MLGHQIKNNLTDHEAKPTQNVKITDAKGNAGSKKNSCDC